ncbi:glycogen synthase [Gilvimarinus sp. F26214L]|uniref:glycogen synthase n=1 Tax=Gilvimarinus sp. DZF01 TaxID=3461371 RepID=UPI0040462DBA
MHILMIAAENDALPGGKVGGIGDVIRDLPPALAAKGHHVSVITPGYQMLSKTPAAKLEQRFAVNFATRKEDLELFRVAAPKPSPGVDNWVLEHELFGTGGPGTIYCTRDREPFATDANKFALFCTGVAEALARGDLGDVDILHCHDWHTAPILLLRRSAPRYRFLQDLQAVYSIHNLSIQGVRPLADSRSSLKTWFPDLTFEKSLVVDPTHPTCLNWMRTGINLADRVHAVSPTYAREILEPTDHERHFIGGENLEKDLQKAHTEGRLIGVLNGCYYTGDDDKPVGKGRMCQLIESSLVQWVGERTTIPAAHFHALQRVTAWRQKRRLESFVVTSVGRLTDQKNRLLCERLNEKSVLEHILHQLNDGIFILLGSGEQSYQDFFTHMMARHDNFLYLQGYSDELSKALYSFGDLFLMPSSFEPCGISQMLAMRAGTPCLVHRVGGLRDTVEHGVTGFSFEGDGLNDQARQLLRTFSQAMRLKRDKPPIWGEMCRAAAAVRFTWDATAEQLLKDFYSEPSSRVSSGKQLRAC